MKTKFKNPLKNKSKFFFKNEMINFGTEHYDFMKKFGSKYAVLKIADRCWTTIKMNENPENWQCVLDAI